MHRFNSIADWDLGFILLLVVGGIFSVYIAVRKVMRGRS